MQNWASHTFCVLCGPAEPKNSMFQPAPPRNVIISSLKGVRNVTIGGSGFEKFDNSQAQDVRIVTIGGSPGLERLWVGDIRSLPGLERLWIGAIHSSQAWKDYGLELSIASQAWKDCG